MARIDMKKIIREHKPSIRTHDVVRTTYDVYEINGVKYLHLDTYGRPNRQFTEKISQTIQLDEENCILLVELINKSFNR